MYSVIINGTYFGYDISKEVLATFNLEAELAYLRNDCGVSIDKVNKIQFKFNMFKTI